MRFLFAERVKKHSKLLSSAGTCNSTGLIDEPNAEGGAMRSRLLRLPRSMAQ